MVRQKSQVGMAEGDPKVYIQNCAPKQRTPVAGDAKAPAMSSSAQPCVSSLRPNLTNYEIKCALMTEIRRFGRQYGRLFKILEEVQGPLEVKIQLVEFSIKEAARFKRRHLIQYLEKILEKLKSERSLNNNE
ncbi:ER membrane protein complex subunit 5 isoform X3 [Apodemus sylvaticus]|nr:ER membrane protein complex subunit 5 isoform X3 [Apodemus sylvaticus]